MTRFSKWITLTALVTSFALPIDALSAQAAQPYIDIWVVELSWHQPQTGRSRVYNRYFVNAYSNGQVDRRAFDAGWQYLQQYQGVNPSISKQYFWRRSVNTSTTPQPTPQGNNCVQLKRVRDAAYQALLRRQDPTLYQDYAQKDQAWKACRSR